MNYSQQIILGVELEFEILHNPNVSWVYTAKKEAFGSYPKFTSLGKTHAKHGNIVEAIEAVCEDKITVGYDNTINDGFECVGDPMNLEDNKRVWSAVLAHPQVAPYIHGEDVPVTTGPHGSRDVGMHIHISGEPITPLVLGKMHLFVNANANRQFMNYVAGRVPNRFSTFKSNAKVTDVLGLYHNVNCHKRSQRLHRIKHRPNGGFDVINSAGQFCCQNGITIGGKFSRGAMWLTPYKDSGEAEIRIFKSAVSVDRFIANLEFCVALVEFCVAAKLRELTSEHLWKWIKVPANKARYARLYKLLRKGA